MYGRSLQIRKEAILKQKIGTNGYASVVLCKNKHRYYVGVHRLIALAFLPNPLNKPTVNHKNGNKLDNTISNLEWNTYKEQINHADENKLRNISGEASAVSNLKNEDVLYMRKNFWSDLKAQKSNAKDLCKKFNIGQTTFYNIIRKRTWKHI